MSFCSIFWVCVNGSMFIQGVETRIFMEVCFVLFRILKNKGGSRCVIFFFGVSLFETNNKKGFFPPNRGV
jgi:hypothetical protein